MSSPAGNISDELLHQQFERIISNPSFARSKSLIRLLSHLLESHIEGRIEKESALGVEVFDRGADFDPASDNIVRVQAGNLRAKLKAYYDGPGSADPIVIRMPAGGYALTIGLQETPIPGLSINDAPIPDRSIDDTSIQGTQNAAPSPLIATADNEPASSLWRFRFPAVLLVVGIIAVSVLLIRNRVHAPPSVAILPFSNLDADPSLQFYADGLTEELIEAFARTPGTSVTARTSVWSFRNQAPRFSDIRNALRVDSMVEGSVRRNGDRLRILVRLMDTSDGHLLWSGQFEPKPSEIASAQQQIGAAVAAALKLSPQQRVENLPSAVQDPELYELYERGRAQWFLASVDGAHQAISLAAQAIVKNPAYASAYVVMAGAYSELVIAGRENTLENWQHVKDMASKAIAIDPSNAEAHMLLAGPLAWLDWDYAGAEREFRRALELAPGNAVIQQLFGSFLSASGRFAEAEPHVRLARKLDPLNPLAIWVDARLAYWSGDYARSAAILEELRKGFPNYALTYNLIPRVWPKIGRTAEAIKLLEFASKAGGNLDAYGLLGYVYAQNGQAERAREIANRLEQMTRQRAVPPTSLAFVYIGLGENAKAVAALEKACDERSLRTSYMIVDPMFQPLKADAGFQKLLKRVGLAGNGQQ